MWLTLIVVTVTMAEMHWTHDVCTHCHLVIAKGEEVHPTVFPFHVRCKEHGHCYVFCIEDHPDYIEWYTERFHRAPVQRIAREPGWYDQHTPEEEYVPCPSCSQIDSSLYHDGPGRPVRLGGVVHARTCPLLPHPTPEQEEKLRKDLEEMDRARRRAWEGAHNHVIG